MTNHIDGGLKKTSLRSLNIAETVMRLDGATLAEVTSEMGLAKSTAYSHLETLRSKGYLVKEDETYQVGLQFLDLGGYAASRKVRSPMIHEKVSALAKETSERAQFIVEENGLGIYLCADAECPNAIRTDVRIGKKIPLHTTAAGKSILANLSRWRVQEIIDQHGLVACTDRTITDPDELFEILESVRQRGYAFNRGERVEKQWAVGVPILGKNGEVIGGLSVTGPEHRLKGEYFDEDLPRLLMGVADEVELTLAFS